MFPRLLLALFLLFPGMVSLAQPASHSESKKEYYPGTDKVKRITHTRITRNKHPDLDNYYKKTTTKISDFDEKGKPLRKLKKVTKQGKSGKHCYVLLSKETQYDTLGRPKHFEKSRCDKQKEVIKEYQNGNVIFIRVHKKRKPWSGCWFFS